MARTKKSNTLTMEERLDAALVPEDERPYGVPDNWCWTYLSQIAEWGSGGTPSRKNPSYYKGNIPWIKTGELEDGYIYDSEEKITDEAIAHSSAKIFPTESVLIAMYGATIGRTAILGIPATTNQACACAQCKDGIYNKFLFYYLRSKKESFIEQGQGGAQPNISQDIIKKQPFPLSPLVEQHRIVERIESLFSQLDEARDKAQEALADNEARNATLYRVAFTGELTKVWREKNAVKSEWRKIPFGEAAEIQSNLVDPSECQNLPHIAPDNIEKRTGRLLDYNTIAEDKVTSGKHRFYSGQILYSKIRPYLSKVVMVDFDGLCSADMYPIRAKENTKFLFYQMLSDDFLEQASSAGSRSVLPKINQKELSQVKVSITSEKEQIEVVRVLDNILPQFQRAREAAEEVIGSIALTKKAILAKAFRGELGTNDPKDESAIELLKQAIIQ